MENVKFKKDTVWTRLKHVSPVLWVVTILFAIYALALLFPLLFAFNSALKSSDGAFLESLNKITLPFDFKNFAEAFTQIEVSGITFWNMLLNSGWFSVGTTFFNIFSSMCLAYGVAKYKFPGRNVIYNLVLIIMIFPVFGTLAARYKLYSQLGFIDSPLILLAYAGAYDAQFLILYAFFRNIDWAYAESAFMDGASHFKVFFRIMMPMALPAIAALAVTNFIVSWNDYEQVLLYLPNLPTLSTGLYVYATKSLFGADRPLYYAGILIALVPVFVVYLALQNTVIKVTVEGGVKE